ncbi:ankyrin repeat-containing protein At5g02620 [Ziziphus jujuba]|uniref:Ankyrin repeat-containing protein At5g02620 n=1 Tax=Ziziphus jujuba TaxID=326968 RepID=A0ABM3IHK5_ZIZJJ|nr:ankyrin repeat-containing protein At5g02620 [Ziziphus jujuba]
MAMDRTVFEAAASGDKSLIQRLQQHGVDPHQSNTSDEHNSSNCPKIGSEEMVKLLIGGLEDIESHQADTIRMKNLKEKDTALHVAIKNGNFGVAKLLMENDPGLLELVNNANESPLFLAVEGGFLDITQHILRQFPSALCCSSNGMNVLHAAVIRAHHGVSALLIAGRQGHVNAMAEIIGHNPDACDLVDNRGWTPLHAAIANERLNVVRYILKKPMLENLINAVDNEGNTPLNVAARRDKYSIITILVNDLRVQKKAQNLNFQKPIDFIRTNPNIEELCKSMIAKKLDSQEGRPSLRSLVHGMDIHEREVEGFTMPGGYEQDQSSTKGLAMLSNKTSFKVFVIADSIAFYCSSTSVFIQFCGSLEHNYHLLLRFTRVAATLSYISSLGMM